jgi:hypothetical protein
MQYYRRKQREGCGAKQKIQDHIDTSRSSTDKASTWVPGTVTETPTLARIPSPKATLVRDDDRVIYQASSWHRYVRPSHQQSRVDGWQQKCKDDWNVSFWQAAQRDNSLLKVFICFAVAKESALTGALKSHAYYHHKGKAMTLVSHDINSNPARSISDISS